MKIVVFLAMISLSAIQLFAQSAGTENFDANWKFHLGNVAHGEQVSFSDQNWRILDLPHDWSIEGSFMPDNPSGHQGGLLPGGIGWYRKKFELSATEGKKYFIVMDGVYKNSTVYVNGHSLGTRPYGYATFQYDMTPFIQNGENVLAVIRSTDKKGGIILKAYSPGLSEEKIVLVCQ